ncbi:unnamed protein product [Victoria cruziana]
MVIYYASKMLVDAQIYYTTTEKELLAVVFALEKFRSYILGSKEFDLEIKDKKGTENVVADHLYRVLVGSNRDELPISDRFSDESLLGIMSLTKLPWYVDYCNYLVTKEMPSHWSKNQRDRFLS